MQMGVDMDMHMPMLPLLDMKNLLHLMVHQLHLMEHQQQATVPHPRVMMSQPQDMVVVAVVDLVLVGIVMGMHMDLKLGPDGMVVTQMLMVVLVVVVI
jgi:hypothetical protein